MDPNPSSSLSRRFRWWASDVVSVTRGAVPTALPARAGNLRVGPDQLAAIEQCVAWLNDYIGQPHPELGRNGDICPFVRTALRKKKMSFVVADEIGEPDVEQIRRRVLYEGWRLMRNIDETDRLAELTTTNLLLPSLEGDAQSVVHEVHATSKASLMRHGVMTAAFYPGYDKPAIYNEGFELYQSPFPVIVVRPMALHDILFLDHHREAFGEYHSRFAPRYHSGGVSDEHGYPDRFRQAEERFDLAGGK